MAHPYTSPSHAMVFSLINQENGTNFNPTDVSLQNVRPDTAGGEYRNTAIDVVGNPEEGIEGTVTMYYRRLDIADVFSRCDVEIKWRGESDTFGVMKAVNALYGTSFVESDIEVTYFNPNVLPLTVNVVMRDDSLGWTGSLSVRVVAFTQSLQSGMVQVVDPVFDYPTGQSIKAQGPIYLRPYSFNQYWTFLKGLSAGQQTSQASQSLRTLVNGVLPSANQWVLSAAPAARNLAFSDGLVTILYAGPPLVEYTHRLDVNRIIVMLLGESQCTDVSGYLVMHFSNPALDLDDWIKNKDIGEIGL